VHKQVGDFFKFTGGGDIQNVIAAIGQIIAATAHGAQGGVTGGCAGKATDFFGLKPGVVVVSVLMCLISVTDSEISENYFLLAKS
jgi:hypothetical protein